MKFRSGDSHFSDSKFGDSDMAWPIERRHKKRCPKCQFFKIIAVLTMISIVVFLVFNMLPNWINKGDFQVLSVVSYQRDNSTFIDADLKIDFPEKVVDALENGIPLTIAVEVQIFRERPWWRNVIIKQSRQLFELRYHPLTDVHEVKNIATDDRYSFNSRKDAMVALGTIRMAHLIKNKKLENNNQYYVQMRLLLDVSRLPVALRQVASLSPSWRVESTWSRWPIKLRTDSQISVIESQNEAVSTPPVKAIAPH
jgi:hypothetical protein